VAAGSEPPVNRTAPRGDAGEAAPDAVLALEVCFQHDTLAEQVAAVQAAPAVEPGVRELLVRQLVAPATAPPVRTAIAAALQPVAPALQEVLADLPPAADAETQAFVDQLWAASQAAAPAAAPD
jgi:hypothetical protein